MTDHHVAASGSKSGTRIKKKSRNASKKRGLGEVVDRGTETVERLHRAIASWPLDALERVGRFEKPVARVRKLQERSISARYAFVRGLNREVVQFVRAPSGSNPKRGAAENRRRTKRPSPEKADRSEKAAPLEAVSRAS